MLWWKYYQKMESATIPNVITENINIFEKLKKKLIYESFNKLVKVI